MPRRRPNPKKKSARKQREADNAWLGTDIGQGFLGMLDLQQCCPELTLDAMRRRVKMTESTNSLCIDLSGCSMTALPASIGSWKSSPRPLIELNLSHCKQLAALPGEIGEIKSLESLKLEGCSSLVALPDAIGEIRTLNYLNLTGCVRLASLPDAIGDLEALQILDLTCCSVLQRIPSTIGELKVLKALSLANCMSLSALPDTINEIGALKTLILGGCSSLALRLGALAGLGALKALVVAECDSIEALNIDGLPNLTSLDLSGCNNLRITSRAILALREQRVEVKGFSVRKMMRDLRNQAKRRRQRRLCDYCGRQGGIDEPRLPVCYCGQRRYCDETCQRAGWAHEHSENCSFGFLTALQIESLQKAEDAHSKGLTREAFYRALRGQILQPTAPWALARDSDDSLDGSCDSGDRVCGFTPSECDELLAQGVKPWDADAGAVLAALGAGDDSSSIDSTYANSLEG